MDLNTSIIVIIASILFLYGFISVLRGIFNLRFISGDGLKRVKKESLGQILQAEEDKRPTERGLGEAEAALLIAKQEVEQARSESERLKKELTQSQLERVINKSWAEEAINEKESIILHVKKEIQRVKADAERLKEELARSQREVEGKGTYVEEEIKRKESTLSDVERELQGARAESERLKAELTRSQLEAEKSKSQMEEAKFESHSLKSKLNVEMAKVKAREDETKRLKEQLERMNSEYGGFEERAAELKKIESDILWLAKVLDEQKQASHQMKQRIEENRIKMQLLNEKTKANVETIARFAEGKEFAEFRKSIYLDDIIQKYEEEIKELRIKNMELENRLKEHKE